MPSKAHYGKWGWRKGVRAGATLGLAARNHPRAGMLQCITSSASHNGADTNGSGAVPKIDLGEAAEAAAPVAKVARRTTEETAAAPAVEAGTEAAADAAPAGKKVARRTAEETVAAAPVVKAGLEGESRAVERTAEVALTVVRG